MMPNKIKYATAIPKKLDAPSGLCPSQNRPKGEYLAYKPMQPTPA